VSPSPHSPLAAGAADDLTDLLVAWQAGREEVRDELFDRIYDRLVRLAGALLARQGADVSLQATELVHEAYLRLLDQRRATWQNRAHFFAIAGRLLRRVLVDRHRQRVAGKRGGGRTLLTLEGQREAGAAAAEWPVDLIALDFALQRLATVDVLAAELVELRFFAGLELEEAAEVLGVGRSTVVRRWRFARAWLHAELGGEVASG
jgi:RNA polymerase sigma-70 factor, ECF subfamily